MSLTLRIRGRNSMKRVTLNNQSTYNDLLQQITQQFPIQINDIVLSTQPLITPQFIQAQSNTPISQFKFNNGDVLYLSGETEIAPQQQSTTFNGSSTAATSTTATQSTTPKHKLTSRCQHGSNGACVYCSGVEPGTTRVEGKCTHGPNATCIHCMNTTAKNENIDAPASWLCNHPDNVFCPKCIPKDTNDDNILKHKLDCDCKPGQMCARCAVTQPSIKVDKIPFKKWLADKRALCQFKHNQNTSCAYCSAPEFPSYTGKQDCNRHPLKWPYAVCLNCAPPNAILRQQPYRHCDSISIEASILQPFYTSWLHSKKENERAGILFGKYIDEPNDTLNTGAIRAQVHCLYEPPQNSIQYGVEFTQDKNEKLVHDIASALKLEPVGWSICKLPVHDDVKYGGDVLMSGNEVRQAARLQWRYKDNKTKYSRFVSLIVEYNEQAVEPRAYQISDEGVALEHDRVLGDNNDDGNLLAVRKPAQKEMIATVVYKDRPLQGGDTFLPDELLVKCIVSAPKQKESILSSHSFPSNAVHNSSLTQSYIQSYLADTSRISDWKTRLSDFNLLVALVPYVGKSTVIEICNYIADNKPFSSELQKVIQDALKANGLTK